MGPPPGVGSHLYGGGGNNDNGGGDWQHGGYNDNNHQQRYGGNGNGDGHNAPAAHKNIFGADGGAGGFLPAIDAGGRRNYY